jgi:hypothetical protein
MLKLPIPGGPVTRRGGEFILVRGRPPLKCPDKDFLKKSNGPLVFCVRWGLVWLEGPFADRDESTSASPGRIDS